MFLSLHLFHSRIFKSLRRLKPVEPHGFICPPLSPRLQGPSLHASASLWKDLAPTMANQSKVRFQFKGCNLEISCLINLSPPNRVLLCILCSEDWW